MWGRACGVLMGGDHLFWMACMGKDGLQCVRSGVYMHTCDDLRLCYNQCIAFVFDVVLLLLLMMMIITTGC